MQFVIRGNTIQVKAYRGYDAIKKRAIVEMIGSLSLADLAPNDKLLENCTEEEKLVLAQYIQKEMIARRERLIVEKAKSLAGNMDTTTAAIRDEIYQLNDAEAKDIYDAMDRLTKQLKKSGILRQKN